jgi:type III pantothenate kinase
MTTPLLAVGIGNTTVKLGLTTAPLVGDWPVWSQRLEVATVDFDPASLANLLPNAAVEWRVASVQRSVEKKLRDWLRGYRTSDRYQLLRQVDMPIRFNVEAPHRVGLDRIAAAVAANRLRDPRRPAVVVDAGTAITVNLVTADGVFQGGVILPGFTLTAKALAVGTDQLPLVTADLNAEPPRVVGKSTDEAIRSGLFWGNVGAVKEILERMHQEMTGVPQVFVTGGDARRLAGYISADARFIPDLVLAGIVMIDSVRNIEEVQIAEGQGTAP